MKISILSLIGTLVVIAFAPQASALPAFARQTGMECAACHQQHFPVLNAFGRSFKAAGYTMMGAQGLVEGEHLSIPNTLNAAILMKVRYQKDNGPASAPGLPNTPSDGMVQFGDELSLFFGGRVAENIGVLFEGNTVASGALMAGIKFPIMFDASNTKLSVIPFSTDALSVQYGYELSSGGVMRANRWAENRRETSAVQYNADRGVNLGGATGVALVAQNDLGFINYTKWSPNYGMGANGGAFNSFDMSSNYIRVAATPTLGDWAMVAGVGVMGGQALIGDPNVATAPAVLAETKQTFADLQAHGELAGNELGVYAQYANAPVASAGLVSAYGAGVTARKAYTLGVDYSVVPHILSIGAAYRNAKNGGADGVNGDNAVTLTAVYDLAMNVALHANYSKYSGSANTTAATPNPTTNLYTMLLEAAW